MQNKGLNSIRRYTAGIIGLMLLVVMLFSGFYIAAEAHHECIGEKCEVCLTIRQCQKILHEISDGLTVFFAVVLPLIVFLISYIKKAQFELKITPVSIKVRLNN